jgi:hypothetical protein
MPNRALLARPFVKILQAFVPLNCEIKVEVWRAAPRWRWTAVSVARSSDLELFYEVAAATVCRFTKRTEAFIKGAE